MWPEQYMLKAPRLSSHLSFPLTFCAINLSPHMHRTVELCLADGPNIIIANSSRQRVAMQEDFAAVKCGAAVTERMSHNA